jgi:putative oxidoreductase
MSTATERYGLRHLGRQSLNLQLWAVQTLAALALARCGLLMMTLPIPELTGLLGEWVSAMSVSNVRLLGVTGILGAFAIWAPSFVRIVPKLAGVAAVGLASMLALAALVHGVRGALGPLFLDLALVGMMMFIAWGRLLKSPIQPHAHIRC